AELATLLKRQQITATKMTAKGKEFNIPTFGGGVNAKELAIFTRQFSDMIDAGLPLVQCLEILASQQENKFFQKILAGTRAQVEGGATLSAAMRSSPKAFDALYVNMVEAGETGGILGFLILGALCGSMFVLKVWYGTPQGRLVRDTIVLKLPVLGMLMRKIAFARFTRTLGTLISSGVPILEGLDITARTAGNAVV